jgi:hypothetical protein
VQKNHPTETRRSFAGLTAWVLFTIGPGFRPDQGLFPFTINGAIDGTNFTPKSTGRALAGGLQNVPFSLQGGIFLPPRFMILDVKPINP